MVRLIQVSLDIADPDTRSREVRALIKASKALRCDDLLILTEDREKEEELEWFGVRRVIRFQPLWKWLLEDD